MHRLISREEEPVRKANKNPKLGLSKFTTEEEKLLNSRKTYSSVAELRVQCF